MLLLFLITTHLQDAKEAAQAIQPNQGHALLTRF
jgi:hypothetical protein